MTELELLEQKPYDERTLLELHITGSRFRRALMELAAQDLARITAELDAYKKVCDGKTPEEMDAFLNLLIEKQAEISKKADVLLERIAALKQSS